MGCFNKENAIYTMPATFGPAICELQNSEGKPFDGVLAKVEQYVMAYRVAPDQLKEILPECFTSLRPVLRINIEVLKNIVWLAGNDYCRIEFNTPVEYRGKKGWLNLVTWENNMDSILYGRDVHGIPKLYADIEIIQKDKVTRFQAKTNNSVFLDIVHERAGAVGGCPKENDNEGTFHFRCLPGIDGSIAIQEIRFMTAETIENPKEYCNCTFKWNIPPLQDAPVSYPMFEKIASITCQEVLGAYVVTFNRTKNYSDQVIL